jgi:hypothetical protein
MKPLAPLVALLALVLSGCATYMAVSISTVNLKSYHKIYVISNLDDNHHIDLLLVQALQQQGKEAESGPHTMIPEDAQAIINYQDHWLWDFSDHLVGLSVEMRDSHKNQMIGRAFYSGTASMRTSPPEAIQNLITDLLNKKPSEKPPAQPPVEQRK